MKKEKKGQGGKKGKASLLKRYNDADATKNVKITAMKTGADFLIGVPVGTGLGALLGIWSPLAGFLMIGAGHYFGDKSGLLRIAGAATIAYGVAKAAENRAATKAASLEGISLGSLTEGAKGRLVNFKDNWLQALYIDKLIGKKDTSERDDMEEVPVGAIDLSELDVFENLNKDSAVNYELQKIKREGSEDGEIIEGLNYAIIEEEFDINTL
jgi:F0F1-type ATP synthase assembly protein I